MKAEEEAKTNAEEGGRTLNEGRKGDQDQCRRRQTSGYGVVRGARMPRGCVGTRVIRVRGRSSNHCENGGGTQKETLHLTIGPIYYGFHTRIMDTRRRNKDMRAIDNNRIINPPVCGTLAWWPEDAEPSLL